MFTENQDHIGKAYFNYRGSSRAIASRVQGKGGNSYKWRALLQVEIIEMCHKLVEYCNASGLSPKAWQI